MDVEDVRALGRVVGARDERGRRVGDVDEVGRAAETDVKGRPTSADFIARVGSLVMPASRPTP